jgi:hypothetical protein
MGVETTSTGLHATTAGGLVVGAVGISILWTAGQDFPFYPPPGIVILVVGALFVGLTSWRWTPAVGAFLGLFVAVGFLVSGVAGGDGFDNLSGVHGTGRAIGQVIQLIGAITALVAGALQTRANYSRL